MLHISGLIKRSNWTIEECIKKQMMHQEDWEPMLPSVLFVIRISKHCSTGLSPYRMLYQRDPVLPFQFMDRMSNGGLNSANECLNMSNDNDLDDSKDNNIICDIVDQLEHMQNNVFSQASQGIKKAQKHQAKCYNARHGGYFKVGDKVLKRNMHDAFRKAKLTNKYTGLYIITDISISRLYFIQDKYSHQLKRPIPPNQLVCYYGVGGFCKPKVEINDNMSNRMAGKKHSACDNSHFTEPVPKEGSENHKAEGSSDMSSDDSSDTDTISSPTPKVSMQSGCQRM